jgi:hypothetical protein
MLTRQEVEGMDYEARQTADEWWVTSSESPEGRRLPAVIYDNERPEEVARLLAAAPELALACLEAHDLANHMAEAHERTPLGEMAADLLRALDAALALAGVQP